jgi:hypothetical protein
MTQVSSLLTENPMDAYQRVSRRDMMNGLHKLGVKCPAGAKHSEMVTICQAQGIQPQELVKFVPVVQKTPTGDKIEMYPEAKERVYDEQKELRRNEEFERRIQEGIDKEKAEKEATAKKQESEIQSLKSDMDELKGMFKQLVDVVQEKKVSREIKPKETDPLKMKWMSQRKWLKDRGIELNKGDDAKKLIAEQLAKEV